MGSMFNGLASKAISSAVSYGSKALFGGDDGSSGQPGKTDWLSRVYNNIIATGSPYQYSHIWIVDIEGLPTQFSDAFGGTIGNTHADRDGSGYSKCTYAAQSVSTPGVKTSTSNVKTGVNRSSNRVTTGTEYEDFSISFFDTEDGLLYNMFYALVSQNHQSLRAGSQSTKFTGLPTSAAGTGTTNNHYATELSASVVRMSADHNVSHVSQYGNIIPKSIGNLDLSYEKEGLTKFTVSFSVELVAMSTTRVAPQLLPVGLPNVGLLGGVLGSAQKLVGDTLGGTIGGIGNLFGIEGADKFGAALGNQAADALAKQGKRYATERIGKELSDLAVKNPILARNSRMLTQVSNNALFGTADVSQYRTEATRKSNLSADSIHSPTVSKPLVLQPKQGIVSSSDESPEKFAARKITPDPGYKTVEVIKPPTPQKVVERKPLANPWNDRTRPKLDLDKNGEGVWFKP